MLLKKEGNCLLVANSEVLRYKEMVIVKFGNLLGSITYEVKEYRYAVGNKPYADIQILDFLNGTYGGQAVLLQVDIGKKLSNGEFYNSLEQALSAVVSLIEQEIQDDDWVQDVQRSERK
ncbi:hypothetical protein [Halalkalibacter sp. APA_J-10(15)]|uniref:hypothetical protein n=1 Tax=Halalkalibacter sp. APA_J-10(15) TaxID=2933805 RepID=UPI001FF1B4BD|nr:hypothetical protein [Halalkalibacter sp. APA_J-10(15)]MCK0470875.1 hypothetical protein [Halalkalibacter sp. APA_J-10(15)]